MTHRKWWIGLAALTLSACGQQTVNTSADQSAITAQASTSRTIGVNVALNQDITDAALSELSKYGRVRDQLPSLDAVTMQVSGDQLEALRALPFVASANPDAERSLGPITTAAADNLADGTSSWDLDAMDITDKAPGVNGRVLPNYTGESVYVAVLDTGLVQNWQSYFPSARIATEYARSFGGGGGEVGTVSSQPNKWGLDQNSHGTHVTSSILGFKLGPSALNGVAPKATVIPVKVLNQNGSGWSSVIARGIEYVTALKSGPLADHPVVINMSLGGSTLDAIEKRAIDNAIAAGVIVVASAGNSGDAGMGYPGGYNKVISVAASGYTKVNPLKGLRDWRGDVSDPLNLNEHYIADFSSRDLGDATELDVTAPGEWIVGPYQVNGQLGYYFLSGTSMSSPHVAGLAALMLEKNNGLTQASVEAYLKQGAADLRLNSTPDKMGSGFVTAPNVLKYVPAK